MWTAPLWAVLRGPNETRILGVSLWLTPSMVRHSSSPASSQRPPRSPILIRGARQAGQRVGDQEKLLDAPDNGGRGDPLVERVHAAAVRDAERDGRDAQGERDVGVGAARGERGLDAERAQRLLRLRHERV